MRTPTSHCAQCKKIYVRGDRVRTAFIASRRLPKNQSFATITQVLQCFDFELTHADCADTGLTQGGGETSVLQRVDFSQCARCRRMFLPGHRLTTAFIVEAVEPNPAMPFSGAVARLSGTQGEYVHIDCNDPALGNGITVR